MTHGARFEISGIVSRINVRERCAFLRVAVPRRDGKSAQLEMVAFRELIAAVSALHEGDEVICHGDIGQELFKERGQEVKTPSGYQIWQPRMFLEGIKATGVKLTPPSHGRAAPPERQAELPPPSDNGNDLPF